MRRREHSAGGVVLRRVERGVEVALAERTDRATSARSVCLPKGLIDPGESPEQTAVREVAEETGLRARVLETLPEVRYRYLSPVDGALVAKRVQFYAMAWEAGQPHAADGEMDRVFWYPLERAPALLRYRGERRTVEQVLARVSALLPSLAPAILDPRTSPD
ncbi:MAG TPA: NUDIX domain-containing protein [Myxococcota bacterium]|nr:NUDIX domain-containing protein [Myxococcota bacterium]